MVWRLWYDLCAGDTEARNDVNVTLEISWRQTKLFSQYRRRIAMRS